MKRKTILLVGLLFLFMIPMLGTATEYAVSEQSIISFTETLPDDTMFPMDNESYGEYIESFADVSDWVQQVGGTWGSDTDLMYADVAKDGVYDYYYSNVPEITDGLNYYYEVRAKNNISDSYKTNLIVRWWSADSATGSDGNTANLGTSSSWQTFKGIITSDQAIECVQFLFYVASTASGANRFSIDYLRISPSNETGWQHDFSDTTGITNLSKMDISTDGDLLTLTATASASGSCRLYLDNTTTHAALDADYYPFLAINASSITAPWSLTVGWSDASTTTLHNFYSYTGVIRYNLEAVSGGLAISYIALGVLYYGGNTATFDFIKIYSIANYTYTGTGTSNDDVLYVSSGELYCEATSITSIVLDHDPALSEDTSLFNLWNVTTSEGIPQFDHYVSSWQGYSSDTTGTLATGTLTDVRIKFTDSANIAAIKFMYVLPEWQEVGTAIFYFNVPFDYWALNMGLVFGGLIIMLFSVCLMAVKVRDRTITRDAGILLFFLFCVGWGLFIGGTLIG